MRSIGDILKRDVMPELERRRAWRDAITSDSRAAFMSPDGQKIAFVDAVRNEQVYYCITNRFGTPVGYYRRSIDAFIEAGELDGARLLGDDEFEALCAECEGKYPEAWKADREHISAVLGIPPERPTQAERRVAVMDDAGF